ncbi:unknown [Bacteroides intestinalis CAG:315]|nr:unknown [Bacteroides intestinalis CAG:315]
MEMLPFITTHYIEMMILAKILSVLGIHIQ